MAFGTQSEVRTGSCLSTISFTGNSANRCEMVEMAKSRGLKPAQTAEEVYCEKRNRRATSASLGCRGTGRGGQRHVEVHLISHHIQEEGDPLSVKVSRN